MGVALKVAPILDDLADIVADAQHPARCVCFQAQRVGVDLQPLGRVLLANLDKKADDRLSRFQYLGHREVLIQQGLVVGVDKAVDQGAEMRATQVFTAGKMILGNGIAKAQHPFAIPDLDALLHGAEGRAEPIVTLQILQALANGHD